MSKNKSSVRNIATSTRATIIDLLCHCEQGAFANEIVPARLARSNFSDPDKALITKVVYSTLRMQVQIDDALEHLSSRSISKLDTVALCALRSIIAQLIDGFNMYAAVDETIKVLPFSTKGFVNAIARKAIDKHMQSKLFIDQKPHVRASMPKWIFDEVQEVFNGDAQQICESLNASTKVTLASTTNEKIFLPDSTNGQIIPEALLVRSSGALAELDIIKSGKAIVVDQGSQLVAKIVDAKASDVVLDVCSAPGGKSILISKNAKQVFAGDISPARLRKLRDTLTRVKRDNIELFSCDARHLPLDRQLEFDAILVDAPCSGLGVLRRRPDARHRINPAVIDELVELQKQILLSVASHVKTGGYLIYSVCTFSRAETIEIDDWLKDCLPEFHAENVDLQAKNLTKAHRGFLLAPTADNDAMFVLKLKRK